MTKLIKLLILLTTLVRVNSWNLCNQTFCENVRYTPEGNNKYVLEIDAISPSKTSLEGILSSNSKQLSFKLTALKGSTFHLTIDDASEPRYRDRQVLLTLEAVPITVTKNKTNAIVTFEDAKAVVQGDPFKIEFYNQDRLVSIVNAKNRMVFDTTNSYVACGVTFPQAQRAYGLPEHADWLSLRTTTKPGLEPYRHFNVDYAGYKVESTEALYGAVGVLYAHALTHSSGVFWFNTAQTWVDINAIPNLVDSYFMSETGAIEMFVLTGPTLAKAVQQYAKVTGVAPLPQYFTLGYHQSRYSYMSQQEVLEVVDNFDKINLPLEVIWLDIDYTDGKKYFTWNTTSFPNPSELQTNLLARHRSLVTIIDPHFKVDNEYFVHVEATAERYYVRNKDGGDYVGKCWPGDSSYLDFFNPAALNYYASLFNTLKTFNAVNVYIWNDMNEPSVFEVAKHENTMDPTLVHYKDVQHKSLHNSYGLHQTMGTHKGIMNRPDKRRPFVLTRSHFAGTQRYAAIWTGDNVATWEYLRFSFPMCLTEALAGISFCGADVAGFGGIPTDELYQRWYQAGAWLPFYRGHSDKSVPRREPYLYPASIQQRVRNAIEQRYAHIPVWYTVFREHELYGEPVIRPIIYEYPHEGDALSIDDHIFVGKNILAAPILQQGVSTTNVYLPGGASQNWFNIDDNFKMYNGTGFHTLAVTLNSVPVFYRGGSIIFRKDLKRLTTADTEKDPYTVYICLNYDQEATGTLYDDDHTTFDYNNGQHIYLSLKFVNNMISLSKLNNTVYEPASGITKMVILNPPRNVTKAKLLEGNEVIAFEYSKRNRILTLHQFSVSLAKPFTIELLTATNLASIVTDYFLLPILTVILNIFL